VNTKLPFERVVIQHGPTVLRVCRAMLAAADADDAWSDTFLAALEAYPRLPARANVEAWLVTIAHRKAIDTVRRAGRRAEPVADIPAQVAGDGLDGRDIDLTRALADLPDKQRFAVVYHYLAGLPYAQVAGIVGGTESAARRAAADGIANLRKTKGMDS
jgi:RNA polymerase sigma factor (sigma-70 family)